ncbi:MAG: hypothetical protein KJI69_06605, partial [Patescibacteria group bacterium]|nr:hypothetical protein [Patescibacteria group bacterium]
MNKKGALALSQIFILMIGIIAVSYAVGSQVGFVSGFKQIKLNVGEEGAQAGFTYWLIDETTIQKRNSAGGIDGLYKYGTWTSENIKGWIFHDPDGNLASNYVHVDDALAEAAKDALAAQQQSSQEQPRKTNPQASNLKNLADAAINKARLLGQTGDEKYFYWVPEEGPGDLAAQGIWSSTKPEDNFVKSTISANKDGLTI